MAETLTFMHEKELIHSAQIFPFQIKLDQNLANLIGVYEISWYIYLTCGQKKWTKTKTRQQMHEYAQEAPHGQENNSWITCRTCTTHLMAKPNTNPVIFCFENLHLNLAWSPDLYVHIFQWEVKCCI